MQVKNYILVCFHSEAGNSGTFRCKILGYLIRPFFCWIKIEFWKALYFGWRKAFLSTFWIEFGPCRPARGPIRVKMFYINKQDLIYPIGAQSGRRPKLSKNWPAASAYERVEIFWLNKNDQKSHNETILNFATVLENCWTKNVFVVKTDKHSSELLQNLPHRLLRKPTQRYQP